MKSLVSLVLLAQLLSCKAGLVLDAPPKVPPPEVPPPEVPLPEVPPPEVPLPEVLLPEVPHQKVIGCDDAETEAAATFALGHINRHLKHGYLFDLNRIEKVSEKEERPHGKVMELELDLLETTCHIVSTMPAENCTVRKREEHAVEGDCKVKMIKNNGQYKVLHSKCHSSPDSHEHSSEPCPNCINLSLLNDSDVVNTANAALAKYNAANSTHEHYNLLEISRGHHSHLGRGVYTEFAIVNTNCSAQHAKEHVDDCHVATGDHLHFGFCKAFVRKGHPEDKTNHHDHHDVHCTIYDHQPGISHHHLMHHLKGKLAPAGRGSVHHDLIHSHNDTSGSHSHSDEVGVAEKPAALAKRSVLAVLQRCPGRYRHFDL